MGLAIVNIMTKGSLASQTKFCDFMVQQTSYFWGLASHAAYVCMSLEL